MEERTGSDRLRILGLSVVVVCFGALSVGEAFRIAWSSPDPWQDAVLCSEQERTGRALGRFEPVYEAVRRSATLGARLASLVPPDQAIIDVHFQVQHLVPQMGFMLVITGVPPGMAGDIATDYRSIEHHLRRGDLVLRYAGAEPPPPGGLTTVAEGPLFTLLRRE